MQHRSGRCDRALRRLRFGHRPNRGMPPYARPPYQGFVPRVPSRAGRAERAPQGREGPVRTTPLSRFRASVPRAEESRRARPSRAGRPRTHNLYFKVLCARSSRRRGSRGARPTRAGNPRTHRPYFYLFPGPFSVPCHAVTRCPGWIVHVRAHAGVAVPRGTAGVEPAYHERGDTRTTQGVFPRPTRRPRASSGQSTRAAAAVPARRARASRAGAHRRAVRTVPLIWARRTFAPTKCRTRPTQGVPARRARTAGDPTATHRSRPCRARVRPRGGRARDDRPGALPPPTLGRRLLCSHQGRARTRSSR